ncbi:MAG: hypothetical protein WBW45_10325, partial [Bradyrhizobium sp.]
DPAVCFGVCQAKNRTQKNHAATASARRQSRASYSAWSSREAGSSGKTEKSFDFWPSVTSKNPSAAMPRLSNSRMAAALLGIRLAKRQVSTIRSSAWVNMIWSRSPRLSSPI